MVAPDRPKTAAAKRNIICTTNKTSGNMFFAFTQEMSFHILAKKPGKDMNKSNNAQKKGHPGSENQQNLEKKFET